jgi:ATP-dependent DNA helicase HFM1/MER3
VGSSRKGTSDAAGYLANIGVCLSVSTPSQTRALADAATKTKNKALQSALHASVGFHHAGMESSDRLLVETLFRDRVLQVLCTTSTLALGVNLPAYLVIIKGTRMYVGLDGESTNGYREYDRSACLQMIGRAGRPQFDTKGVAVIMTTTDVCGCNWPLESAQQRIFHNFSNDVMLEIIFMFHSELVATLSCDTSVC